MEYDELYKKYIRLQKENEYLRNENIKLNNLVNMIQRNEFSNNIQEKLVQTIEKPTPIKNPIEALVNNNSRPDDKIKLFNSLFRGRSDVYAKRWEKSDGKGGYSPLCLNEWHKSLCNKPNIKCSVCSNKLYDKLDNDVINKHLRGEITVGIFPMLEDETCYFLAIDFDDGKWQEDILVIREICYDLGIPFAIERSRSGNGAHMWFFFEEKVAAYIARQFGSALLTYSMERRYQLSFSSYDRLFPNQDYMPKGGLGNLIALPLQKIPRQNNNSIFVDENFNGYKDQWAYLSSVKKITKGKLENYLLKLSINGDLGYLNNNKNENEKPWKQNKIIEEIDKVDLPKNIELVKANMLYLKKEGLKNSVLNKIKRFAAFKNPDFYRNQAMRLSTYNKPRIISLSEDTKEYLALPRGCEGDILDFFKNQNISIIDERNNGLEINIAFNGTLRLEQEEVIKTLLKHENGVISATTAFGKTVIGANIIANKKINTLIIVHTTQLLEQWKKRLEEFLITDNTADLAIKNKKANYIGQFSGGKNKLTNIIDIATMQSLCRGDEVKEFVKNYGMIIVDECHHVSAFSLEQILRNVYAKYVYGLTATPIRKDGHEPIIFMQCGPLRYKVNPLEQAEKRPFNHYIIPRFTGFRMGNGERTSINDVYSKIVSSQIRNDLIISDILKAFGEGRNSIVLTERTVHVEILSRELKKHLDNVIILTGNLSNKDKKGEIAKLRQIPKGENFVIVATGKLVGEGFDEPRLDTLFLAMPISWKGTLQQYSGRLHRIYEDKLEVQVYDYVDIHINVLEKMYQKRLRGYSDIGYKIKTNGSLNGKLDSIYNKDNYLLAYQNDIRLTKSQLIIASPYISKAGLNKHYHDFVNIISQKVEVVIIMKPLEEIKDTLKQSLEMIIENLKENGIIVRFKSNLNINFSIIDKKTIWYGGINPLASNNSDDSLIRLDSYEIPKELLKEVAMDE